MSTATIPRLDDLVKARGDAPPANIPGFWIVAGTPVGEPYPCSCRYSPCRYEKCDDRTRTEGDALPPGCCGRRNAPVAEAGFARPPAPRAEPAQTAVERSALTGVPGEGFSSLSGERRGARGAFSCDCPTPWDPPPPVLLIAAGRDGPVRRSVQLAAGLADVRAAADEAIGVLGRSRVKPWKDGRHVLLPPAPGARGKTRPCWHAPLDDGTLAVLDTPDETGSGVHCPDCHQNFQNAGAWQIHRGRDPQVRWREVCKDPATVLCVDTVEIIPAQVDLVGRVRTHSAAGHVTRGVPLLRRTIGGVWAVDPLAPWGEKGAPIGRDEASTIWTRAQERLASDRWRYGRGHNRKR